MLCIESRLEFLDTLHENNSMIFLYTVRGWPGGLLIVRLSRLPRVESHAIPGGYLLRPLVDVCRAVKVVAGKVLIWKALPNYSSIVICYRNNFMIDHTLRQTLSAPLLYTIVLLLRCCLHTYIIKWVCKYVGIAS